MGFLDWLRGDTPPELELRHTDTEPSAYPIDFQLDSVMWHQHNGPMSSEAVPAVYAAIDLISASIAQLGTFTETPLSRRPDPFSTRSEFFFETTRSLCFHGDAFWLLTRLDRGVESLQVLDPREIEVSWDDLPRRRRSFRWNGQPVDANRIEHLRFHPRPGELLGLSPIEAARLTWEGAAASEVWGSSLFAESGVPSGVLEVPTPLDKPESEQLQKQWSDARRGGRTTAVLSGGAKYAPVSLSPADIEWLETRASTAQEVARIFHIPSDFLEVAIQGGSSSLTYKNLAEVGADLVQWCLGFYMRIIEDHWAVLPGQPPIKFDPTPLYRPAQETRARTFQILVSAGVEPEDAAAQTGFDGVDFKEPEPVPQQEVEPSNV